MTDQLQLDFADRTAESADRTAKHVGQLRELPGSKWEHIFDMPAPDDEDADET